MSTSPRIYVVTACFNSERTIAATLDSVSAQRDHVAGHFIVDGASTDGTLAVVESRRQAYGERLTVTSEPDAGIYDAMNKGIRLCLLTAHPDDLVATLNADDAYLPGALDAVAHAAADDPRADMVYGDVAEWDDEGEPTGRVFHAASTLTKASASAGMPIAHPATFVRARVYHELGMYDTSYRIAGDYEFVLRLLDARVCTRHIDRILAAFRQGGVSTSQEIASYKEAIRARVAHGSSPAAEWARFYKRRAFARIFALIRWIPGVAATQRRFGASARNADWTDRA